MSFNIKELKPNPYGRFKQGYYQVINQKKYLTNKNQVIYRSSWELKFMRWLDMTPEIVEWASEPVAIKYFYTMDQQVHTYFPDFYFCKRHGDGTLEKFIVEVKPKAQLQKPELPKRKTPNTIKNYNYLMECFTKNYCKKLAAKKWCEDNGYKYVYLTEDSKL